MTVSDAIDFIDGKSLSDWKKAKEAEYKVQAAIGERLNGVIRACGVIVKAISGLGKALAKR